MVQVFPSDAPHFVLLPLQALIANSAIPFDLGALPANSALKFSTWLLLLALLVRTCPHTRCTSPFCALPTESLWRPIRQLPHTCRKVPHGPCLIAIAAPPAITIRTDALAFREQPLLTREGRLGPVLSASRTTPWGTILAHPGVVRLLPLVGRELVRGTTQKT